MPTRNLEGSTAKLRRRLAGDLDDIVMMALRKEPDRRYGSVDKEVGKILTGIGIFVVEGCWKRDVGAPTSAHG
jgi:hypothetical protein